MWEGIELSLPGNGEWRNKDGMPDMLPVSIKQTSIGPRKTLEGARGMRVKANRTRISRD
jgi:hypothetical protein